MQEIKYTKDNQQFREMIVGMPTLELKNQFQSRADAARNRLESGEIDNLEIKETYRVGRNDPCPCTSGLKFKKCCGKKIVDDPRYAEENQ